MEEANPEALERRVDDDSVLDERQRAIVQDLLRRGHASEVERRFELAASSTVDDDRLHEPVEKLRRQAEEHRRRTRTSHEAMAHLHSASLISSA